MYKYQNQVIYLEEEDSNHHQFLFQVEDKCRYLEEEYQEEDLVEVYQRNKK